MGHARFFFGFVRFVPVAVSLVSAIAASACSGTTTGTGIVTSCEGGDCPATDPFSGLGKGGPAGTPDGGKGRGATDAAVASDATVGGPCERDVECDTGLCNLGTDTCATPAAEGAKCWRDKECVSGLCNEATETCQ